MSRTIWVGDRECSLTFYDFIDHRPALNYLHPIATATAGIVGFGTASTALFVADEATHVAFVVAMDDKTSGGPLGYLVDDDYRDVAFQRHLLDLFENELRVRLYALGAAPTGEDVPTEPLLGVFEPRPSPGPEGRDPWEELLTGGTPTVAPPPEKPQPAKRRRRRSTTTNPDQG